MSIKSSKVLHERVYQAIIAIGGIANLQDIYKKVRNELSQEGIDVYKNLEEQIRCVIYKNMEGLNKKFIRLQEKGKGVYLAVDQDSNASTLLIHGDGRKLEFIENNSIDAIVTDHPWNDEKALKGGNQKHLAEEYKETLFAYTKEDIKRKHEVLKEGGFCVEVFPQLSGTNIQYFLETMNTFISQGFDFYTSLNWVKGEFSKVELTQSIKDTKGKTFQKGEVLDVLRTTKQNQGRKTKDGDMLLFFTKGTARSLSPDKMKIKRTLFELSDSGKFIIDLLKEILENESFNRVKLSSDIVSLKCSEFASDTGFKKFSVLLNKALKNKFLKDKYCMSGTRYKLPARFLVPEISHSKKIHDSEKPIELFEMIIDAITKEGEVVLDQFAGSCNTGIACMNKGRNSILVEYIDSIVIKGVENLKAFNIREIFNMDSILETA